MASAEQYTNFSRYVLSEVELRELDYPRPDPEKNMGNVKLYGDHFGFREGKCKRCRKTISDLSFNTRETCAFHTLGRSESGEYRCCKGGSDSNGCKKADSHVHKGNLYTDLQGYRKTQSNDPPPDGNWGVYALDTESVHTVRGLEVCKVSVIDTNLEVVYNDFCKPTPEIVDYNTIWSGIKEKHLEGVTKTYDEMRDDILGLISADTIIVGHGLNNDLVAMKIIHDNVVDTVVLYPHERGLPRRKSLKDIAESVLGLSIQTGEGHDSKEDAEVTMKLALNFVESP